MRTPLPRSTNRPPACGTAARAALTTLLLLALAACGDNKPTAAKAAGTSATETAVSTPASHGTVPDHPATPAAAESTHEQAAHVHGEAELLVVTEAGQVEVRLESPAESLIGFEHPPGDPQDWQQAAAAMAALSAPALVTASDAEGPCEQLEMTWSTPLFSVQALRSAQPATQPPETPSATTTTGRHEDGHPEARHEHDDAASGGPIAVNEGARDDGGHGEAGLGEPRTHAGINAIWRFRCSGEPAWLEQRLLATFPDLEKLDVQLATATAQRAWEIGERAPGRFSLRAD